jgi:hypothetical protein
VCALCVARCIDRAGNATTTSITVTRVLLSQPPQPAVGQALLTQSLSMVSGTNQTGAFERGIRPDRQRAR